jgi:hypothetical protein
VTNHNFQISNCDTDSISFCKEDGSYFSPEERKLLVTEINSLSPELMKWADDGYYKKVIILKAKNYILQKEDGKITYKGSSLKDQKTELALKEFKYEIIGTILDEKFDYVTIYNKYVKEILNLTDIKRWASKKTLSETTYTSQRTNETKIIDCIKGTDYKQNDRIWVYFDVDSNLKLVENYNNDHDIMTLVKKLFTTAKVFVNILPKDTFINYSLKKNQALLQELK